MAHQIQKPTTLRHCLYLLVMSYTEGCLASFLNSKAEWSYICLGLLLSGMFILQTPYASHPWPGQIWHWDFDSFLLAHCTGFNTRLLLLGPVSYLRCHWDGICGVSQSCCFMEPTTVEGGACLVQDLLTHFVDMIQVAATCLQDSWMVTDTVSFPLWPFSYRLLLWNPQKERYIIFPEFSLGEPEKEVHFTSHSK